MNREDLRKLIREEVKNAVLMESSDDMDSRIDDAIHNIDNAYTTGAYIIPTNIEGKWYWTVREFDQDSFIDGENFDPQVSGDDMRDLFKFFD